MASDCGEVLWLRANFRRCKRHRLSGMPMIRGAVDFLALGKCMSYLLRVDCVTIARGRYGLNTGNIRKQFEINTCGPAQYAYRAQEHCAVSRLQVIVPILPRLPLLDQHRCIIVGGVQIEMGTKTSFFIHYRHQEGLDRLKEFAPIRRGNGNSGGSHNHVSYRTGELLSGHLPEKVLTAELGRIDLISIGIQCK